MRGLPLAATAAIVAAVTGLPLLGTYFTADDFEYLFQFANYGPDPALLAAPRGGHMCLVRNVIFFLTFRFFRMDATWYFAVVLATHVVNVVLLYAVVRRLTESALLACFGAVLFAVSPADAGTLGWYSAYGHALATTFVLVALLLLVPRAETSAPITTRAAAAAAGCMLLASQCFGTGAAAAMVLPILAVLLRPSVLRAPRAALLLAAVPVLVVVALRTTYAIPTRYANPDDLGWIVAMGSVWRRVVPMAGHILVIGLVSLVLGDAYPLTRYPDAVPAGTFAAFALAVAWALIRGSSRTRRALLAFLALAIGAYGSVAAGRATMYSALRPNDLLQTFAAMTRYHYLAQTALAVVLCLVLAEAGRRTRWMPEARSLLLGVWLAWAVGSALLLRPPINHYDANRAAVARVREAMAEEIETHPPGTTVCVPNRAAPLAVGFPGSVGVFMLFERENALHGRRVYFTSSDPGAPMLRDAGGRLRSLLLPAGACPPPG